MNDAAGGVLIRDKVDCDRKAVRTEQAGDGGSDSAARTCDYDGSADFEGLVSHRWLFGMKGGVCHGGHSSEDTRHSGNAVCASVLGDALDQDARGVQMLGRFKTALVNSMPWLTQGRVGCLVRWVFKVENAAEVLNEL